MKILLCHNYYRQRGGEDQSFDDEARLLESNGQEVIYYTRHNDDTRGMNRWTLATRIIRNRETYGELRRIIRRHRPDVLHCTNTFLLLSPAVYDAARQERVPVVQALRNYRLLCPAAILMRDGQVCEDCLRRKVPWPGIRHACYRNSRLATAAVAAMLCFDRWRKSRASAVSMYYTPSEFARGKFIEGGFPAERIAVKPNFIASDPGVGSGRGGYAVFVGRLSKEKGIDTLLAAWSRLKEPLSLKIIGNGPLEEQVRRAAATDDRIEVLGARPIGEVLSVIGDAICLVMPSVCYETFGRVIAEAFAKGTPVVASRLGAPAELVADGETGLLFEPGDADNLALKVRQLTRDGDALTAMRKAARHEYEQKFTAESNHDGLMAIYRQALAAANSNGDMVSVQ